MGVFTTLCKDGQRSEVKYFEDMSWVDVWVWQVFTGFQGVIDDMS